MQQLSNIDQLLICQKKEWTEAITGFENCNRYEVFDRDNKQLYIASEISGSRFKRWFLKGNRPFQIDVVNKSNELVLSVKRPYRFFYHKAEVFDREGTLLGVVTKRFTLLSRVYSIKDGTGREIYKLNGPLFKPWTFTIFGEGGEDGQITKEWSGLFKEGFTDADNFALTFPVQWTDRLKLLMLGTVFLIDFVHFESTGGD